MVRRLAITLLALGFCGPAVAEPHETAAVTAAVDRFLAAINTNDAAGLKAVQMAEGMTYRVAYAADGKKTVSPRSNAEWVARAASSTSRFHEQYWSPKVMIHRDIAVFWAPYSFDVDGKRSHCGIDVFDLVKANGEWKIANSMWTVEPEGCPKNRQGVR